MKPNIYFKHAVLTKLALLIALLFLALWLACLRVEATPTSLDNLKTLAVEHGNEVNPVPIPRDSLLGSFPKLNRHFLSSINPDSTGAYHTSGIGDTSKERGDVKCQPVKPKSELIHQHQYRLVTSSAASTFNPKDAACPQSVKSSRVSEYPKVSMAEIYVRLLDTPRHFSVEPPPLILNLKH